MDIPWGRGAATTWTCGRDAAAATGARPRYQHDARSLDWDRKNRDRVDESIGIDNKKTMYPCGKCGSTKVSNYEKQTRSGDEPMTQFFECSDCGHRWRF